jgi:SpoU rRNA methylase family enzyme
MVVHYRKFEVMVYHYVFDELADLLASMDPDKVLVFRTSEKAQLRLDELLEKNKNPEGLSKSEQSEMEQFMLLEHIVSLAKARALKKLAQKQN